MVAHTNRGRLTVDVNGKWRLYTNTIPKGSVVIGTVERSDIGDKGALVRIEATSLYVQVNAGAVRSLPQGKVKAALKQQL